MLNQITVKMIKEDLGHKILGALIFILWVNDVFILKSWVSGFVSTILLTLAIKNILHILRKWFLIKVCLV